jgi:hypothetical protein
LSRRSATCRKTFRSDPEADRRLAQLGLQQRIAEDLAKQMVATPAIQEQADAGGQSRGALSFGRSA